LHCGQKLLAIHQPNISSCSVGKDTSQTELAIGIW
jgi:hypothetical protein